MFKNIINEFVANIWKLGDYTYTHTKKTMCFLGGKWDKLSPLFFWIPTPLLEPLSSIYPLPGPGPGPGGHLSLQVSDVKGDLHVLHYFQYFLWTGEERRFFFTEIWVSLLIDKERTRILPGPPWLPGVMAKISAILFLQTEELGAGGDDLGNGSLPQGLYQGMKIARASLRVEALD